MSRFAQTGLHAALALMSLMAFTHSDARAQAPDTSFVVEQFEPLPNQGTNILNVGKSEVLPHLKPSFGLALHFQDDPFLLVLKSDEGEVQQRIIDYVVKGEIWASLGLFDWFDIGLVMPVVLSQKAGALLTEGGQDFDSFTTADLRIVPKLKILDSADFGGFGLGLMAPISLPTGDDTSYNSEGVVRIEPRLIIDWRSEGGFVIAGNIGYQPRKERKVLNFENEDALKWGLGLEVPLDDNGKLQAIGTVFGTVGVGAEAGATRTNPVEALAGIQWWFAQDWVGNIGGGAGLTGGVGSPDVRIFATLGYTPRSNGDLCPGEPEDMDGFQDDDGCPDPDNDGDGVLDVADGARDASGFGACRNDPEDKDGFEDPDGCPDPDNDKDGVLDVADGPRDATGFGACRDVPEDKDGFEDGDGCADLDNDKDGVLDVADGQLQPSGFGACLNDPEDKDGFEDEDGCPDPDNDKDGIPDVADKCPLKPETVNGFEDADGCPDTKGKNVQITDTQIVILKKVFFAYNRDIIKPESYGILDEVVAVLAENPWIGKIRVDGHTDSDGVDAYNLDLSTRRAASVMSYLKGKGIDPTRLSSQGFGETVPLNSNKTAAGRADNRRVEFTILEANGKSIRVEVEDNRAKTTE